FFFSSRRRHTRFKCDWSSDVCSSDLLIAGLLEHHDRSKFEVFGISFGPDDRSDTRQRLVRGFDRFMDVRSQDDAQAARLIHELRSEERRVGKECSAGGWKGYQRRERD